VPSLAAGAGNDPRASRQVSESHRLMDREKCEFETLKFVSNFTINVLVHFLMEGEMKESTKNVIKPSKNEQRNVKNQNRKMKNRRTKKGIEPSQRRKQKIQKLALKSE
jgi:hypothetical protein